MLIMMTKTTGLILVIISIILFILLIVNYEYIIFTEASLDNSTSTLSLSNNSVTTINETIAPSEATISEQPSTTYNIIGTDLPAPQVTKSTTMSSNNSENTLKSDSGDRCATSQTNATAKNETSEYFDIDHAINTFQESMTDKNAISLSHYLNGFRELMKFFHSLGTIFLFVTSDLESKICLLENYRNNEKGCNPAYSAIQSAIDYEMKENLLQDSKRPSGARTILRLHRALEFLSAMMLNLSKLNQDDETAPSVREAYTNTLSKHHPWTIRTIASFAMRTLPQKKNLVESVLGRENSQNETLNNERMLMLANTTLNLYNVVDKYYEEHDLKNLP